MYDFNIALGCFGLRIDDFIACGGVENPILQVSTAVYRYNDLMDYLDQCRLFDKAMFDSNAIKHFIFNLQNQFDQLTKPLWTNKKFELYQKFLIDHRHCGLYLKLQMPEESFCEDMIVRVDKPPKISQDVPEKTQIGNGLKLIRGRR